MKQIANQPDRNLKLNKIYEFYYKSQLAKYPNAVKGKILAKCTNRYKSIFLSAFFNHLSEFGHKFWPSFEDEVSTSGVLFGKIVGLFPLVNEELISNIETVVIVVSSSYFIVPESNSSSESSQIVGFDVLLLEEAQDLLALGVVNLKDFWFCDSWVVAAIADGARIVVGVELVEEHYWI
jgi:hypothetical protein